jgi:hypothetical protein
MQMRDMIGRPVRIVFGYPSLVRLVSSASHRILSAVRGRHVMPNPLARRSALRVFGACTLAVLAAAFTTSDRREASGAAFVVAIGVTEAFGAPAGWLRDATRRPTGATERVLSVLDSLRGRSGKLRARLVARSSDRATRFAHLFGDSALHQLGVHDVGDSVGTQRFSLITIRDFADKLEGRIGNYRIGYWPAEEGRGFAGVYGNPSGFIEVTSENMDTPVSEHFRLRDFLTHDQPNVWPKYLVLREDLVDKLELVIEELERSGHPVRQMRVMSGFRTPQYNATGGETGGRASLSRHMYGDAADVFVDNDGDGRMDDLNGDGRIDHRDAQVILDAVERVERMHPDVVGGVGVYRATSSHGPFAHVDVRGHRARWGLL